MLPIYEKKYPTSQNVRLCIEASRNFAYGLITDKERAAAAWAAWAAAAWAAPSAEAWSAAAAAAWPAASAAASARAARPEAARVAELDWQKDCFLKLLAEHDTAEEERHEPILTF